MTPHAHPARSNYKWSAAEDARLLELAAKGLTSEQLAGQMQRGVVSVQARLEVLAEAMAIKRMNEVKTRLCLNCRKPFRSAHSMNRRCTECRKMTESPFQPN